MKQEVPLKLSLEIYDNLVTLSQHHMDDRWSAIYTSDDIADFEADVKILRDFIIEQYKDE